MIDPNEDWKYIGKCKNCGAALYSKDGMPLKAVNPEPECLCQKENCRT